jgi:phosphoribosylaminoimidazolecarboxamide formyltransferase/IMP cyclohydrolase
VSAFGGIVGFNRAVDADTAQELSKLFLECVIAPGYHPEAREILGKKANLRLLEQSTLLADPYEWDIRKISGGFLMQEQDLPRPVETKSVTRRAPSPEEQMSLAFAWQVVKQVKSNAIVLVRGRTTCGIGAGQMSRIDSMKVAHMKMAAPGIDVKKPLPIPKTPAIQNSAIEQIQAPAKLRPHVPTRSESFPLRGATTRMVRGMADIKIPD